MHRKLVCGANLRRNNDDRLRPSDADAAPDLADALAIIAAQRARAEDTRPSGALLFGLWGAAWLVGYGALWLTTRDDGAPSALAVAVAIAAGSSRSS